MRQPIRCAHPDCDRKITDRNGSGVCRYHNHTEYCRCSVCRHRSGQPVTAKTAVVPRGYNRKVKVSLDKAPWEDPK